MRGVGNSSVLTQLLVANYEPTTKALDDEFVLDDWDGTLDEGVDDVDDVEKAQPFGTFGGRSTTPSASCRSSGTRPTSSLRGRGGGAARQGPERQRR